MNSHSSVVGVAVEGGVVILSRVHSLHASVTFSSRDCFAQVLFLFDCTSDSPLNHWTMETNVTPKPVERVSHNHEAFERYFLLCTPLTGHPYFSTSPLSGACHIVLARCVRSNIIRAMS